MCRQPCQEFLQKLCDFIQTYSNFPHICGNISWFPTSLSNMSLTFPGHLDPVILVRIQFSKNLIFEVYTCVKHHLGEIFSQKLSGILFLPNFLRSHSLERILRLVYIYIFFSISGFHRDGFHQHAIYWWRWYVENRKIKFSRSCWIRKYWTVRTFSRFLNSKNR